MKSAIHIGAFNNSRARRALRGGTALSGVLAAALLASPAHAACVEDGDTTTCSGDVSGGISTSTPNVVVENVTTDISASPGVPAFWMPGLADLQVDMGGHVVNGNGVPALASLTPAATLNVDFTGDINATGANTSQGGTSGMNFGVAPDTHSDITINYAGNITVNASRDASISPYGNVGISVAGGAGGTARITSVGDISLTVTGEPLAFQALNANASEGAYVDSTGNISVTGPSGIGDAITAASLATTSVTSRGDLDVDIASGIGEGISAGGVDNIVDSIGNITVVSSLGSGIDARGVAHVDESGGWSWDIANSSQVTSVGNISTTGNGSAAIVALGETVTVDSTGDLTTTGNDSAGILAIRAFTYNAGTGEMTSDDGAQSVSVTSNGNITTSGTNSRGIVAGASNGIATVDSTGDITTSGDNSIGIYTVGISSSITSFGNLNISKTNGDGVVMGLNANGKQDGASITSTGNITVSGPNGFGGEITAASLATSTVNSTGDITIDMSNGAVTGISSTGVHNVINSHGNVTANSGGIAAAGPLVFDENGALTGFGIAESSEVTSVGNISATDDGGLAILALAEDVTVNSTGDLITEGNFASGILAVRAFTYDPNTGEATYDNGGTSASVTSAGNISTQGANSSGIFAVANNGTASVDTQGDITTLGDESGGVFARGKNVSIVSTGDISTSGNAASWFDAGAPALFALSANGDPATQGASIVSTGNISTQGDYASGIVAFGLDDQNNASGVVRVESTGNVSTAGDNAFGIWATGGVSADITSVGDVVTTGAESAAIVASSSGETTVRSTGDISTAGSKGAIVTDGNNVTIESTGNITTATDTAGGIQVSHYVPLDDGSGAVRAGRIAGNASVTSTGDISTGGNAIELWADGTATITNNGAASTNGTYAAAIAVDATTFVLNNQGTVTGGGQTTLPSGPIAGNAFAQALLDGGATAISGAIQTIDSTDTINNSGTISGAVDLAAGNDTLNNSGEIDGTFNLGTGDDRVTLLTGSSVTGTIIGGEGVDSVTLDGTGTTASVNQTVAAFGGFESLNVAQGYWTASAPVGSFDQVTIAAPGILEFRDYSSAGSVSATVLAPSFVDNGLLVLNFANDTALSTSGGLAVSGSGGMRLDGPATLVVDQGGLTYTGTTNVANGTLYLAPGGSLGGGVATSGDGVFKIADGSNFQGAIRNDGTFLADVDNDYGYHGAFSGTGAFVKDGTGTFTFAGSYDFTGITTVNGGKIAVAGQLADDTELELTEDGTFDLSQAENGEQTVAELGGTGGHLVLGDTNLTIDQSSNTVFAGSISGGGTLVKQGEGDLKLNGDGTAFTGTGEVSGGTLSVNGTFSNASFEVNEGGKLGGNGTVGDTSIQGGTLGAGNSIGTLNVAGDLAFTSSSVLEVEVDPAAHADLINVSGTATLGGAAVNVLAASGTYRPLTDYTIVTAANVSGTFGSVETNLAFLDPSLSYTTNAVTLRLVRNDIDFAAFGATPNQSAIANLIESFGYGNALYNETLTLIDSDVAVSFASLIGDVYPAYASATVETAEMLRRQTTGKMAAEGTYAWATGLYNRIDSGNGAGDIELEGTGAAGGLGFGANGFSASAGVGILDQGRGGSQFSDGDVTFAIGQLAYDSPAGFSASAGAQYGWVEGDTRRQTTLGAIDQAVTGAIDGNYFQLFGEVSYRVKLGGLELEPFAGVSHVSVDFDSLTETGAPTALAVDEIDRKVTFADFGLRISADDDASVRPFASAAYRTAWGDRASAATVGFAGVPGTAVIGAVPVAKSAAELSAGLAITRGPVDFEVRYDGTISQAFDSHGISAGLKFHF